MRLALDAMGGDHAPAAAVEGALLFAREYSNHEVIVVGREDAIGRELQGHARVPNIIVHHAAEVVAMDEHAGASIRKKKDSSLRQCFELCRDQKAAAMVSAGNSGAVMAGALLVLGRIEGVERPAIAALFPALHGKGRCLLLDAGANVECKPVHLVQFAIMGEAYVRTRLGIPRPRVAVLSNGEEDAKGTALTRAALETLRRSDIAFVGYCEGKDIFSGDIEVVVTDGFTGNIVLKTSEGAAAGVTGLLRNAIAQAGFSEKLGALLLKPTFAGLKKMVDYAEYGGAPILGVRGVAIVAHGRSTPRAIYNALKAALESAQAQLEGELALRIEKSKPWMMQGVTTHNA